MASSPATVAFVHRGADWITGAEQCVLDLVARLDRTRFRPVVVCNAPSLAREAERLGAPTYRFPEWAWREPASPEARTQIQAALGEAAPALVHANMTTLIPSILPVARRARLPLVAHLHMPMDEEYDRLHELVHQADAAVAVAPHVLRPLAADGMPPERLRLIYNAVDAERLAGGDAAGLRAELGIPASATVVGSVGSLIKRKAHDVTVRAVAAARERGTDLRLLVCGSGEEHAALEALARQLGVADAVHLLGYRRDTGAVLRDAVDVLAASAREEALPLNVLEAQWLGLPVVASDIPGHREALAPALAALVTPVEDARRLADALASLAGDPGRRAALGGGARAFARERFSMEAYVAAFDALYTDLLRRPRGEYGWVRGSSWPPVYTHWLRRVVGRRLGAVRRGGRS